MIEFNGKTYATIAEWARAYPAYGENFGKYVLRGAKTPHEIEVMAFEARTAGIKKRDAAPNLLRDSQKKKRSK